MPPRIPYAEPSSPDSLLADVYREAAGRRGRVLNLYKVVGNSPEALRAFLAVSRYVRDEAELAPQLRELAILRTGQVFGVAYEIAHHLRAAQAAGIADDKIEAVADWRNSPLFSPLERAILAFAEETATHRAASEETVDVLKSLLPINQVAELGVICGWYHLCAVILSSFEVELEEITSEAPSA